MSLLLCPLLIAAAMSHADGELAPTEHNPSAPLIVVVTGPDRVAGVGVVELVLEIHRVFPDAVPLDIDVQVPAGVVVESGPAAGPIVDATRAHIVLRIRLRTTRLPEGDVVVSVLAQARSHGALASAVYRFGRTRPSHSTAFGPELRGPGGTRLGHPVSLQLGRSPASPLVRKAPTSTMKRDMSPPLGSQRALN